MTDPASPDPFEPSVTPVDALARGVVVLPRAILDEWASHHITGAVEEAVADLTRHAVRPRIETERTAVSPLADVTGDDLVWLVGYLASLAVDHPVPEHLAAAVDACRRQHDPAAYRTETAVPGDLKVMPLTAHQRASLLALREGQGVDWRKTAEVAADAGIDKYAAGQALQSLRRKGLVAERFVWDDRAGRELLHWRSTPAGRDWTGPEPLVPVAP